MSIFDKMSPEEMKAAQKKLYRLCDKYGVGRFNITDKKIKSKKWQTLVLRQCGLDVPDTDTGRPTDPDTWEIGSSALLMADFGHYETNEEIFKSVVKDKSIKPKRKAHGFTDPHNTVKKALAKVKKIRQAPQDD